MRELADDILQRPAPSRCSTSRASDSTTSPALWQTLADSGLTLLTTPESRGGSGAGLGELAVVLESAGYHAAPVPLAEHDLLASWLLGVADLSDVAVDAAPLTAAVTDQPLRAGRLTATIDHVPWTNAAESIVVAGDGFVAVVPLAGSTIEERVDIAGQPSARVDVDVALEPVSTA